MPYDAVTVLVWILRVVLPCWLFWISFGSKLRLPWHPQPHSRETMLKQREVVARQDCPAPESLANLKMVDAQTAPMLFQDRPERSERSERGERGDRRDRRDRGERSERRGTGGERRERKRQLSPAPLAEETAPAEEEEGEDEEAVLQAVSEEKMHLESLVNFVAFSHREQQRVFLPDGHCVPPPPPKHRMPKKPPVPPGGGKSLPEPQQDPAPMPAAAIERANSEAQMVLRGATNGKVGDSAAAHVARRLHGMLADLGIEVTADTFELMILACVQANDLQIASDFLMQMEAGGLTPSNTVLDSVMELYLAHKRTETEKEDEESAQQAAQQAAQQSATAPAAAESAPMQAPAATAPEHTSSLAAPLPIGPVSGPPGMHGRAASPELVSSAMRPPAQMHPVPPPMRTVPVIHPTLGITPMAVHTVPQAPAGIFAQAAHNAGLGHGNPLMGNSLHGMQMMGSWHGDGLGGRAGGMRRSGMRGMTAEEPSEFSSKAGRSLPAFSVPDEFAVEEEQQPEEDADKDEGTADATDEPVIEEEASDTADKPDDLVNELEVPENEGKDAAADSALELAANQAPSVSSKTLSADAAVFVPGEVAKIDVDPDAVNEVNNSALIAHARQRLQHEVQMLQVSTAEKKAWEAQRTGKPVYLEAGLPTGGNYTSPERRHTGSNARQYAEQWMYMQQQDDRMSGASTEWSRPIPPPEATTSAHETPHRAQMLGARHTRNCMPVQPLIRKAWPGEPSPASLPAALRKGELSSLNPEGMGVREYGHYVLDGQGRAAGSQFEFSAGAPEFKPGGFPAGLTAEEEAWSRSKLCVMASPFVPGAEHPEDLDDPIAQSHDAANAPSAEALAAEAAAEIGILGRNSAASAGRRPRMGRGVSRGGKGAGRHAGDTTATLPASQPPPPAGPPPRLQAQQARSKGAGSAIAAISISGNSAPQARGRGRGRPTGTWVPALRS